MSPEAFAVISDAIKILGPALISAFLGYKVGRVQMDLKLKEMDKAHEFDARKHFFDFYKERIEQLRKDSEQFSGSLYELLGMQTAFDSIDEEEFSKFRQSTAGTIENAINFMPFSINVAKNEMKKVGLDNIPEFEKLKACTARIKDLSKGDSTLLGMTKNVSVLLEIFGLLVFCHELALEEQMDRVFKKYLD